MAASLCNLPSTDDGARAARRRPLVLVTDDHEDTRFLLRTMLERRGYSVIEAADGEEAVAMALDARPDLILMDVSLPRLDGLAAARRIRRLGRAASAPIVFISGHAEPAYRARAREAGCDDFLVKPFDFAQLDRLVEKHLRGREMTSADEV